VIDYATHIAAEEAHTARLAAMAGCRDYIKDKAARMAKWMPSMYGRLPEIVAQTPVTTEPPQEIPNGL
jgi:hypothetical protein